MLFKKYEPQVLTQQTSASIEIDFMLDKTLLFFQFYLQEISICYFTICLFAEESENLSFYLFLKCLFLRIKKSFSICTMLPTEQESKKYQFSLYVTPSCPKQTTFQLLKNIFRFFTEWKIFQVLLIFCSTYHIYIMFYPCCCHRQLQQEWPNLLV